MNDLSGTVSSGEYSYPFAPREQVVELMNNHLKTGIVLDIGAGFGNNTKLLLHNGFSVVATEIIPEAFTILNELADEYPGQLEVIESPVQELNGSRKFDAVLCTMVLHFLQKHEVTKAITEIQLATRKGGYNVVSSYLAGQDLPPQYTFTFEPNELKEHYKHWDIISYEESYPSEPMGPFSFKSAKLIARKLDG